MRRFTVTPQTRLIPVTAWPKYHPWPSVAGLRYLINRAEENGISNAVIRIGRRVLVDEEKFLEWARSHGNQLTHAQDGRA